MAGYQQTLSGRTYGFADLKELMAKATPERSGDQLAGVAAASAEERVAAQICLADLPLSSFIEQPLVPYEDDEVTRLIFDTHDRAAFAPVSSMTAGPRQSRSQAVSTPQIEPRRTRSARRFLVSILLFLRVLGVLRG